MVAPAENGLWPAGMLADVWLLACETKLAVLSYFVCSL